ncbi:hypothetical protein [Flagellimonas algicola]|uniref:PepSY-like beta-lactamase-inhibitor n=1 Tax=Flagellimonas algicola TaxID=2583815 RepID=A0ABY2WLK6_9FLAO|nr:hypothetical protein [Allomuricauda algicola]TMU55401.1 hypothetical protein FGG15_14605 [Allomuricauda algicola]
MKNLILATVLSFVGLSAMAQDVSMNEAEAVAPEATLIQDFQEIDVADLPAAVITAVKKDYPTATINKAYKNESNQFKLELSLKDGASGTVYADAEGNWIEL